MDKVVDTQSGLKNHFFELIRSEIKKILQTFWIFQQKS